MKFFICLCALCAALSALAEGEFSFSAGPLFDGFPLTLSSGHRTEAAGPFFSTTQADTEHQISVPPFFTWTVDPDVESKSLESFYPILTYHRYGAEYRWQLFQLFSFAGGKTQEEIQRKRFTLFPFYFQQRSSDPKYNYTVLLPFFGHLRNRLFRDEIEFWLFPIYAKTRKKDVVTENYIYPFFHQRHGEELTGWQFWPLMGSEHKGVTYKTNSLDERVTIGGHEKFFAVWPFYFHEKLGIGTDNPEERFAMIPFVSAYHSPKRDSVSRGWPFGYTVTDDREKKYHERDFLWPLFVKADGETRRVRRAWPIYSHATNEFLESHWYAWPIYKVNRLHSPPLERERLRIFFFLYSDLSEKNLEAKSELHRIDQWPLFTWRHDREGNERLQVLALLEPLLPNNKGIERNWSPLYSFWRAEKNAKTGASSKSLLWNLYRRDITPKSKKVSMMFGLFQHEKTEASNRWRVFYIPFGGAQKTSDTVK